MKRVVIDTNVLVSSLVARGLTERLVLNLLHDRRFIICLSPELLLEYETVLARTKFHRYPLFLVRKMILLNRIQSVAKNFAPEQQINVIDDEPDNRLLEVALASASEFIITGNTKDFSFPVFHNTRIVTPRQFWDLFFGDDEYEINVTA